jgi:GNAT superfamily N-acetyltransferase
MLENEQSFGKLFSDVYHGSDYLLFYNQVFSDDPIFNHAVISETLLDSKGISDEKISDLLKDTRIQAKKLDVPASIFVDEFRENALRLEKIGIEDGYRIFEKMEILSKNLGPEPDLSISGTINVSETKDVQMWNAVFVRSFAIPSTWGGELRTRGNRLTSDPNTVLLLAKEKNSSVKASGCLLLHFFPPECAGVYCVGTLPDRRNQGVAKALMDRAESLASEKKAAFVTLQTVKSDGVTPMYLKRGYDLDFERGILQSA